MENIVYKIVDWYPIIDYPPALDETFKEGTKEEIDGVEVFTPQELQDAVNAIKLEEETKQAINDKKNLGVDYVHTDGSIYKVSLNSEDANGITTLKVASDTFGFFPTNFKCFNGVDIPLLVEADMLALGSFIASERAKFFLGSE